MTSFENARMLIDYAKVAATQRFHVLVQGQLETVSVAANGDGKVP